MKRRKYKAARALAGVLVALIACLASVLVSASPSAAQAGGHWLQVGDDINGQLTQDQAGHSVALSDDGKIAAVGVPGNHRVEIYTEVNNSWLLSSTVTGPSNGTAWGFGAVVELSGDGSTLAVAHTAPLNGLGYVRVFERVGSAWQQVGADLTGDLGQEQYGTSLALSRDGSRVGIGTLRFPSNPGPEVARAQVFDRTNGSWVQVGADLAEPLGDDEATITIDATGTRIAVGNREWNGGNGRVRVFHDDGGTWHQLGADIEGVVGVGLGASVSLNASGNRVAIGAPFFDASRGRVEVFQLFNQSSSPVWLASGQPLIGPSSSTAFGFSVALADSGSRIVIGALGANNNPGYAMVFDSNGSVWTQQGQTLIGDQSNDLFGWSVDVSGNGKRVAFGAPDGNNENGVAQVWERVALCVPAGKPIAGIPRNCLGLA